MNNEPRMTEAEADLKTVEDIRRNLAAFESALKLLSDNQQGENDA